MMSIVVEICDRPPNVVDKDYPRILKVSTVVSITIRGSPGQAISAKNFTYPMWIWDGSMGANPSPVTSTDGWGKHSAGELTWELWQFEADLQHYRELDGLTEVASVSKFVFVNGLVFGGGGENLEGPRRRSAWMFARNVN